VKCEGWLKPRSGEARRNGLEARGLCGLVRSARPSSGWGRQKRPESRGAEPPLATIERPPGEERTREDRIWEDWTREGKTWEDRTREDKIWEDRTRKDRIWEDRTREDKTRGVARRRTDRGLCATGPLL